MLARQRFRWGYGTLQCLWKHRDALFRPRYGALGFVAMPNVWIFQILFPLISPIMDLMLVYTLISNALDWAQQPTGYRFTNLQQVLFYYALFLAVDWCAAGFAFVLERKERWRLLVVAVPAALLLSPGDVLRHGQVSRHRDSRRRRRLGQAGTESDGRSATVTFSIYRLTFFICHF